MTLAKIMAIS
jgi:hypothetical protein